MHNRQWWGCSGTAAMGKAERSYGGVASTMHIEISPGSVRLMRQDDLAD